MGFLSKAFDWVGDALNSTSGVTGSQNAQQEFQREMSNTAHQREVSDLIAADLNPVLSATGGNGASTPSGSSGTSSASALSVLPQTLTAIANVKTAFANAENAEEQARKTKKTNDAVDKVEDFITKTAPGYGRQIGDWIGKKVGGWLGFADNPYKFRGYTSPKQLDTAGRANQISRLRAHISNLEKQQSVMSTKDVEGHHYLNAALSESRELLKWLDRLHTRQVTPDEVEVREFY